MQAINIKGIRYLVVEYCIYTASWWPERLLKSVVIIAAMVFPQKIMAQYDVLFSHYFDMETSFNPAAAGKESNINITAAYAMDMAGYEHNPQTAFIAADMPVSLLGSMHGVGLQFVNDKIGLFNHLRISAQYAKQFGVLGGTMSIGVQAGLLSEKFNGSGVVIDNGDDPVFTKSDIDGNGFDLSAGLYFKRKTFYVGFSAQHLTAPTIMLGERNELSIARSYYATAGYGFKLRNPYMQLKTSALARTDGTTFRADITGRLIYTNESRNFYGGLTYSPQHSVTILAGMTVQGIDIGYSYEAYTSGINIGNGSHELFIGYKMDLNFVKKGKNLHQSARIL